MKKEIVTNTPRYILGWQNLPQFPNLGIIIMGKSVVRPGEKAYAQMVDGWMSGKYSVFSATHGISQANSFWGTSQHPLTLCELEKQVKNTGSIAYHFDTEKELMEWLFTKD